MPQASTFHTHELRFTPLSLPGQAVSVPCDAAGNVPLDELPERKRRLNTLLTRREAFKRPGRGAAGRSRRANGCRRQGRWWRCGC